MINHYFYYLLFCLLLCSAAGCGPREIPGCTDPDAASYDPEATISDHSCRYFSDEFAGNYIVYEDVEFLDLYTGQTRFQQRVYGLFARSGPFNTITLDGFARCSTPVEGNASLNGIIITESHDCDCGNGIIINNDGTALRYKYEALKPWGEVEKIDGRMVKQ